MRSPYRSPEHAEQVRRWCHAALAAWVQPHEDHDVDTALGRTHVVSLGSADRVCLYLPGTNFTSSSSSGVLEALATRFAVHAADLPGQPGLSAEARPGDEVPAYGRWLAEVVSWVRARHGDVPLVVVGHSRGAAVALSADPDAVHGLALLSPAGLLDVRPTPQMLRATLPWLVRRDAAGAQRLLRFMSGPGHEPAPELVDWMTLVARACRTTGAPPAYPDAVVTRWTGRNVRVVVGEHDVFFPVSRLTGVARTRLGRDLDVVAGAGHLLVEEEPARVTDVVDELFPARGSG